MIGGFAPFKASDPNKVFDNILKLRIGWPRNADKVAKDLITKMLVIEPEMRISLSDIKEHSFFSDIDWSLVASKKEDPPFIPELEEPFSLEYFKTDNKIEMFHNPLFEFDQKAGLNPKPGVPSSPERKFKGLGSFQIQKINKLLEDF